MNHANRDLNAAVARELVLDSSDRVLEVGLGGGPMLATLLVVAEFVAAVDVSEAMVARAIRRFREAMSAGKASFSEADVASLPYSSGSFRKVCTVNSVYYWRSLIGGFAEINRVLAPEGRVVVGFRPDGWLCEMPHEIFTPYRTEDVAASLAVAGFVVEKARHQGFPSPWVVIAAFKRTIP
jgi:SAM-dependent methyltransferase